MARIILPEKADPIFVGALNDLVKRSHSLYGGHTPKNMTLPEPLQSVWAEY